MTIISYLIELFCTSCSNSYDPHLVQSYCLDCNSPLLARYDMTSIRSHVDRDEIRHRRRGMWRWSEILPVYDRQNIISLGEGDTPLLSLSNIGRELGIIDLYLKEEGQNPTGSFKARGLSAAVSKAKELGIDKLLIPSAGNAGGALAAYAARAGMQSLVYMPNNSPISNIIESQIMGAKVELVDGLINEAGKKAQEVAQSHGWFNIATFKEPYRVEGKKIMGFEIAETLLWKLPDVIIYPTGGGTGLIGMWKAFLEMEALGWLEIVNKPKMIAVQASGCAPVVKAFQSGQAKCELWEDAHTIATGLCVPHSFADELILKYVHDSHGMAISVTDEEITEARKSLAQKEGIFSCPEGAATLAALCKLSVQGFVKNDDSVVLFNTGSGLKYLNT